MTEVAIIGPGAVGGIAAAWLSQNPALSVTLCARTLLTDLEIETPDGVITASPRVVTDVAYVGPVAWVLVCTKAYDVPSTAAWLGRLVGPETRVAVLQNGVEHKERFAHILPPEQIIPAVVDIPANRSAPGRVKQHRFGTIIVPSGRDGDDFVGLFEQSKIAVSTTEDFRSKAWAKLCLNSAGAVTTLTQASTGPVWNPELASIVRALVEECAAVARADGAVIDQSVIESVVNGAQNARPAGGANSMEADRLAGRPMEIDARNGAIVRIGRRHGIDTPMNALFTTLISASGSPWVTPIATAAS
jgi:2-dehydropantoate 2-reductase